jgi:hypothetical protein
MSFPNNASSYKKTDFHQKCVFLVSQFKNKSIALWEKYSAELKLLKVEDSLEFYQKILAEYKKLADIPDLAKSSAKKAVKKVVTKVEKTVAAKKVAVKKAVKKVTKKVAPKKAVKKKVTKKK